MILGFIMHFCILCLQWKGIDTGLGDTNTVTPTRHIICNLSNDSLVALYWDTCSVTRKNMKEQEHCNRTSIHRNDLPGQKPWNEEKQ